MTPTDWEEWEALYRADPEAFVAGMNAGRLSAEARSIWVSRLAADGIELPAETTAPLPFTFPLVIGTLIALPFWAQYWRDGGFDPTWAFPWFGLLATLPLMGWHMRATPAADRRPMLMGMGLAVGMTLIVVALHHFFKDWPSSFQLSFAETEDNAGTIGQAKLGLQARDLMLFHAPFLMLGITGAIWCRRTGAPRVAFLRNGLQVLIYTALIVASGGLFTGLSAVMAEMLEVDPVPIAVHLMSWGGASALVFAHHVWLRQPDALQKVLPLIASLFIPLFVLLESGFLLTYLAKGLDTLSQDREELLIFNLLLGAVIGLVLLYSALKDSETRLGRSLVMVLVVLGIVADGVAIAAIGSRLLEWGWTPNRMAVLATNLLCLGTLLALVPAFFRHGRLAQWPDVPGVLNRALAFFLGWTVVVVLALPAHQAFLNRDFDAEALGISDGPTTEMEVEVEALEQEVAAAEAELEAASEATK